MAPFCSPCTSTTWPRMAPSARTPAGQNGRTRNRLGGTNDPPPRQPPELTHRPGVTQLVLLPARSRCALSEASLFVVFPGRGGVLGAGSSGLAGGWGRACRVSAGRPGRAGPAAPARPGRACRASQAGQGLPRQPGRARSVAPARRGRAWWLFRNPRRTRAGVSRPGGAGRSQGRRRSAASGRARIGTPGHTGSGSAKSPGLSRAA